MQRHLTGRRANVIILTETVLHMEGRSASHSTIARRPLQNCGSPYHHLWYQREYTEAAFLSCSWTVLFFNLISP